MNYCCCVLDVRKEMQLTWIKKKKSKISCNLIFMFVSTKMVVRVDKIVEFKHLLQAELYQQVCRW